MFKDPLGGSIGRVEMVLHYDPVCILVCTDRLIDLFRRKYLSVFCSHSCYPHDLTNAALP